MASAAMETTGAVLETVLETRNDAAVRPWVDAAPFRAHLRYLMSVGQMSSSAVALLAGVSPRLAHRLLHGRGGRPLKRIAPVTARRLLRVTASEARAVRTRVVPARATTQHLGRLRAAGWSDDDLADLLGVGHATIAVLICDGRGSCTQLMALRAAAEVYQLATPLTIPRLQARAA
jgi:hypothetical protein